VAAAVAKKRLRSEVVVIALSSTRKECPAAARQYAQKRNLRPRKGSRQAAGRY
jgi:hypothetical protein